MPQRVARNNNAIKKWGALSAWALNSSCISYEPKINSRTVQGERNRAGERIDTEGKGGQVGQVGQGATEHAKVPDESREDVSVHGFWK